MDKAINEITTTFRLPQAKHEEFRKFAEASGISLNALINVSAAIGLKVMKGEYENVAIVRVHERI